MYDRPAYSIPHSHDGRGARASILADIVVAAAVAVWIGFALLVVWEGV